MKPCEKCGHKNKTTREFRKDGMRRTKIIGRPRVFSHEDAKTLRREGMSLGKIAHALGVSKGAVEHATRNMK